MTYRVTTFFLLSALGLGGALPVAGQDTRPGLAVLPFENGGSYGKNREDFDALSRGIAGMLISDLSQVPNLRIVDRAHTQRLLDEQDLSAGGRVDAATAARVGRLVGARYMIAGTFIDLYGEFRIDARVVDVETGEILRTVRSDPRLTEAKELDGIIRSVATSVLEGLDLPTLARRSALTVPSEAITLYSRGLLYEDRGDQRRAVEYYRRALDLFPEYAEAREGLRKAGNR